MSLSYYFAFKAPASTSAVDLAAFLEGVERDAHRLGFHPTLVLNVPFDTPERCEFARRLTKGIPVRDDRLKGSAVPLGPNTWLHNPEDGSCRLLPLHGVVLVLTDSRGCETVFGFFRYPKVILDIDGRCLAETDFADEWRFNDFVDTPDPRYREIVKSFELAGFVDRVKDEFHSGTV